MTATDQPSDKEKGQRFAKAIEELVATYGPPGLTERDRGLLSILLISTASRWTERLVRVASGEVRDPLREPIDRCLLVLQELAPHDAQDAAVNITAGLLVAQGKAFGLSVGQTIAVADGMAQTVETCVRKNWSVEQ